MTLAHDPNDVCGYWFLSTGTKEALIDACRWHDTAYTEGSFHQQRLTRKEVDQWFYQQMLLVAGDDWTRRMRAHAFYGVARVFGFLFWEGEK